MKIYIVTTGSYSDYCIDKVFTDKEKAEEYRKWRYDANDLEEYDTEDDYQVKGYYKITVNYKINDNGRNREPNVSISRCLSDDWMYNSISVEDWHKYGSKCIDITIVRHIPEENWNEEFYTNKYTKAIYDLAAQARQLLFEGWTDKQISEMWGSTIKE